MIRVRQAQMSAIKKRRSEQCLEVQQSGSVVEQWRCVVQDGCYDSGIGGSAGIGSSPAGIAGRAGGAADTEVVPRWRPGGRAGDVMPMAGEVIPMARVGDVSGVDGAAADRADAAAAEGVAGAWEPADEVSIVCGTVGRALLGVAAVIGAVDGTKCR